MKIDLEWEIFDEIDLIASFVRAYKDNYGRIGRRLKNNTARFNFLGFSVRYLLAVVAVTTVVFMFLNKKPDGIMYTAIICACLFIPYFIFLPIFLVIYLIQVFYISIKSLIATLGFIWKQK